MPKTKTTIKTAPKLKLWCVVLTDNDEPHEPVINHVFAKTELAAYELAISKNGLSLEEAEEMESTGQFGAIIEQIDYEKLAGKSYKKAYGDQYGIRKLD